MFFSVDRMVNGRAVLIGEDQKPLEVPAEMLPPGTKNGDMLWYEGGVFAPAPDKAAQRRKQVSEALAALLRRGEDVDGKEDEEE